MRWHKVIRMAVVGLTVLAGVACFADRADSRAITQNARTYTLVVYNQVTNGPSQMREDSSPAYLSTAPRIRCKKFGCALAHTERRSGGTFAPAVCQKRGERTTNGNDGDASDDSNPGLFSSTRYYGIRLAKGKLGYISEVWIRASQRGGLRLPAC